MSILRHALKTRPNRNVEAALYMAASTATFSLVPVIIGNSAIASPFLFGALWRAGLVVALFSYILAQHRHIFTNPESRKIIARNIRSPYMIATTAGQFDYVILAIAAQHISIAVASTVFNIYTMIAIYMMTLLFRGQGRYKPIPAAAIPLYLTGLLGVALTIFSETGNITLTNDDRGPSPQDIAITIATPIIAALAVGAIKWGTDLSSQIRQKAEVPVDDTAHHELGYVLTASMIASAITVPINIALAIATHTIQYATANTITTAILGGMIINTCSIIPWRKANIITNNLGINAISYCTPILTLTWLFGLGRANVARPDYLIIGAMTIIGANILINTQRSNKLSYTGPIIALWITVIAAYITGY